MNPFNELLNEQWVCPMDMHSLPGDYTIEVESFWQKDGWEGGVYDVVTAGGDRFRNEWMNVAGMGTPHERMAKARERNEPIHIPLAPNHQWPDLQTVQYEASWDGFDGRRHRHIIQCPPFKPTPGSKANPALARRREANRAARKARRAGRR